MDKLTSAKLYDEIFEIQKWLVSDPISLESYRTYPSKECRELQAIFEDCKKILLEKINEK